LSELAELVIDFNLHVVDNLVNVYLLLVEISVEADFYLLELLKGNKFFHSFFKQIDF